MKLTVTPTFQALAKGSAKRLQWRIYFRRTDALDGPIAGYDDWTDISDLVDWERFQGTAARLEYELGQFSSDKVKISPRNITWFNAHMMNTSLGARCEIKIEASLAGASDVIPMFVGWLDEAGVEKTEVENGVTFEGYSAEDLASRIAAEYLSTQYLNPDIDGASTEGLVLQKIPGLYLKSANVTSYVLTAGSHEINYAVNGGVKQANLDGGLWVSLTSPDTEYTLGNGATTGEDTQRVKVYVANLGYLTSPSSQVTDHLVVITEGDTLPRQWYVNAQARWLLTKFYELIGITDVTYDVMQMRTWDGNYRVLNYDVPPNDVGVHGLRHALSNDGTDLFLGVGNKLYRRDILTGVYTRLALIPGDLTIRRLWWNERNGDIWILYDYQTLNYNYIRKYHVATDTLSSEVELEADNAFQYTNKTTMEVVDYNYTGSSWKYGLVFVDTSTFLPTGGGDVRFLDGTSMTITDVGLAFGANLSSFLFLKDGSTIWYKVHFAGDYKYYQLTIDGTGAFVDDGEQLGGLEDYVIARYSPAVERIFFIAAGGGLKSHPLDSPGTITHLASVTSNWILFADDKIWFATSGGSIYVIEGVDPATLLASTITSVQETGLTFTDRLYGIDDSTLDTTGTLFQCHPYLTFLTRNAEFPGDTLRGAYLKILSAFILIATISASKKAFVFRRADTDGTPQTTGNNIDVTITDASQLTEVTGYFPKADIVRVKSNSVEHSWNGVGFDSAVLSDRREVSIDNDLIPVEVTKDVAYHAYQFFKTERKLLRAECGILPLFQFEPFDKVSFDLVQTRIQAVSSGPIYAAAYSKEGNLTLEALL